MSLACDAASAQAQPNSQADTSPVNISPGAGNAPVETLESVQVTARRRPEQLVDVPISISVITSKQLEQLDIRNTNELAFYTPSLQFNDYTFGNDRNDRGAGRSLVFRGLNLSIQGGFGGSLFLNGAVVLGNEIPAASMDIGQVEVLRGPQSVYFGRSTETGAVSYRTKAIPDVWSGVVETEFAQRNETNIAASIAGALVPDILKTRLTVLSERSDGYVANQYNNGAGTLGDRERKSISNTLEFTPLSNLSFKTYYNLFKDDDGPSATTVIPSSYDNCKFPGATQMTFCGEIPGRNTTINYVGTTLPAGAANYIFTSPLLNGTDFQHKVGGQRKASNADLVSDWDINGYLHFQAITGYHTNVSTAVGDLLAFQPTTTLYQNFFYTLNEKFSDFSQEFRLSSDPTRQLSWTFGANYVKTDIYTQALNYATLGSGAPLPIPGSLNQIIGKTIGEFAGAYYKVIPGLNISLEGRHQSDDRVNSTTNGLPNTPTSPNLYFSKDFKSWSPRASIDYKLFEDTLIYTSYATGNRPGGFNTGVATYQNNPVALAQIQALLGPGASTIPYAEEKLRIFELGIKGITPDHKGYFDVNAYLGKLTNNQIPVGAFIPALNQSVNVVSNAGEAKIHGLELQGGYNPVRELALTSTFAWNYTDRNKFPNQTTGAAQFGTTDFSGKKFSQVPEYSGSLVGTYTVPVGDRLNIFGGGLDAYFTTSGTYVSKMYADYYNASYIPSRVQVDLRAGLTNKNYTVEGFVRNVGNNQNYTGGQVAALGFGNEFVGGFAPPRQVGARFRATF